MINLNNKCRVKGHYKIKKYNAVTNELKSVHEFDNLIVNVGLDAFAGAKFERQSATFKFAVGAGTSVPAVTNTSLDNEIARSDKFQFKSSGNPVAPDYISKVNGTARFNAGVINNTITEVGVYTSNTYGYNTYPLFSRALILDNNSNPTNLTVLENEYLDCTYELTYYPILEETTGTVELNGVTYSYVNKPFRVGEQAIINHPGNIADNAGHYIKVWPLETNEVSAITDSINYANVGTIAWKGAYEDGTYKRRYTYLLDLNEGNFTTGIGSICIQDQALVIVHNKITFTPKIPKDNTCTMLFEFETLQLARYEPPTTP